MIGNGWWAMVPGQSSESGFELTRKQQKLLLELARNTIAQHWDAHGEQHRGDSNRLSGSLDKHQRPWSCPVACFVTLRQRNDHQLRGCIGTLEAERSLYDGVVYFAKQAAFHDPRFNPLGADELAGVCIEVSVLSELKLLRVDSEQELLGQLRPGIDGLKLESDHHRATFLPQVWEQLPSPNDFVGQLKVKAGLAPDYWSDTLRWSTYQVRHFSDNP